MIVKLFLVLFISLVSAKSGYKVPHPKPLYETPSDSIEVKKEEATPFNFEYHIKDEKTGNDYSHSSNSDGHVNKGEYKILLPDGRTQIVTYVADHEKGYMATVTFEGESNVKPKPDYPDHKPSQPVKIYETPTQPSHVYPAPTQPSKIYEPPTEPPKIYQPPTQPSKIYEPPTESSHAYQTSTQPSNIYEPPTEPHKIYQHPTQPSKIYEPPTEPPKIYQPPTQPSQIYEPPTEPSNVYHPPPQLIPRYQLPLEQF